MPFPRAFTGDGRGVVTFIIQDEAMSHRAVYKASVFDPAGRLLASPTGPYANTLYPVLLAQAQGYQILEGDGINVGWLRTYLANGALHKSVPVASALSMSSSIDSAGGSLIVT